MDGLYLQKLRSGEYGRLQYARFINREEKVMDKPVKAINDFYYIKIRASGIESKTG